MLASNYQMPANGWNGIIELSLGGVREVRGNTKFLGAVELNPDENHSNPVLTSVLRFLQGMLGCAQSSVTQETKFLLLDHHRDSSGALQTPGVQQIPKIRHFSEEGSADFGSADEIRGNHEIMESLRLEKPFKGIESNHHDNTLT